MDANRIFERRSTLVLSGLISEFSASENCNSIVGMLLNKQTDIVISVEYISEACRIKKKPEHGPDKRSFIIKIHQQEMQISDSDNL